MQLRKTPFAVAALLAGGAVLAHHISTPLSSVFGREILSEIVFYEQLGNFGVPGYFVSTEEHGHHVHLAEGDSFTVLDDLGNSEVVTFTAGQFANIADASDAEVAAAINAQLTIGVAASVNGYFALRGTRGGSGSMVQLVDGPGSPLRKLKFDHAQPVNGTTDIVLEISTPAGDHHGVAHHDAQYAHHEYVLLASSTDGSFTRGALDIPLGRDATTGAFVDAMLGGHLPGFQGVLDHGGDAQVTLSAAQLGLVLGADLPDTLYFAYLVRDPVTHEFEFVSNRFTVRVIE